MSDVAAPPGFIDRALRRVTSIWRDIASSAPAGDEGMAAQMRACLDAKGGEVSARSRAARLAQSYLAGDHATRGEFLRALASFDSDAAAVAKAWEAVANAPDAETRAAAKSRLRRVLEPPRLRLLTQFTTLPDGVKFLVQLRADLLARMQGEAMLQALEGDLRGLLASWFDVGFLELRRIDWTSPAELLEKLVGYEAVHRIRTWRDLKNRLDSDRRCYAFFHPRMPDEPLIFVEVALVQGMAASVQSLLDEKAPLLDARQADTAVFYSINNCQRGLDGISFGNFLIKRVVELLSAEFGNLDCFATLSPIPGFRTWLEEKLEAGDTTLLTEEEAQALRAAAPPDPAIAAPGADPAQAVAETAPQTLRRLIARRGWARVEATAKGLEPILLRACARYLLAESGRGGKRARDPVAHFHLSNGARVERLNWRGDTSEKGFRESCGLMVNYRYDPAKIEDYHEDYAGEGRRAASPAIRKLAKAFI
ncbi:malonyl-CoA decarboxylase [Falsiroseomonas tokyonensis]|uniref:Malonyl-CoA decarboxylase n=1 Tax=Falsiroseomonas tokyonensis TaxID=430521 RepID=A0ABV7BT81_9PROT|nr:malonyl-CoA decarboxylase [Falsiroseomonas tokyonensis]MBU8538060.1 malonyl-CoA decarboxylase [Falsiroseomonas tokyonensis]